MGPERDELEPVGRRLERSGGLRRDPDRVQRTDLDDLVVDLRPLPDSTT
jgi:hypothetical protein